MAIVLSAIAVALTMARRTSEQGGRLGAVTYANVQEVFQAKCEACHKPGGIAPFSLLSYEEVRPWVGLIADAVRTRRMPPWSADPAVGAWANDRSLSEEERTLLLEWIGQGAAEGPAVIRATVVPADTIDVWPVLGRPDAVLTIPEPIRVPVVGVLPYRYAYAETNFSHDVWIQGIEIKPSAPEVVHHVLVFIEEPEYPGQVLYETPTRDGFQIGREGWLAAYVPGYTGVIYPPETAKRLPTGATLKFQLHYTPNGTSALDQTSIGFLLAERPPAYVIETNAAMAMDIVIPPGARRHEVSAIYHFGTPVTLVALAPHMHLRGTAFRFELQIPGEPPEVLLDVPQWKFDWQDEYWLLNPRPVPQGGALRATGWFDNSRHNPLNPDPTATVRYGEQTFDEMMNGYFHYLVPNPDHPANQSAPAASP